MVALDHVLEQIGAEHRVESSGPEWQRFLHVTAYEADVGRTLRGGAPDADGERLGAPVDAGRLATATSDLERVHGVAAPHVE